MKTLQTIIMTAVADGLIGFLVREVIYPEVAAWKIWVAWMIKVVLTAVFVLIYRSIMRMYQLKKLPWMIKPSKNSILNKKYDA